MEGKLTRRGILAATLTATALVAAPVAMAAKVQTAADASAWNAGMAALAKAQAAYDYESADNDRVEEVFHAAPKPDLNTAIHWREFPGYLERGYVAHVMDIEKDWQRFLSEEGRAWWAENPTRKKANYRRALLSVRDYRRNLQAVNDRYGYDASTERYEAALDALCDAQASLILTPAPHGEALLWKLEHVMEVNNGSSAGYCEEWVNAIMADARRLLSAGTA